MPKTKEEITEEEVVKILSEIMKESDDHSEKEATQWILDKLEELKVFKDREARDNSPQPYSNFL